jgi:hypothetical protein
VKRVTLGVRDAERVCHQGPDRGLAGARYAHHHHHMRAVVVAVAGAVTGAVAVAVHACLAVYVGNVVSRN